MKRILNRLIFLSALVLLLGQGANQVLCGDVDCLQGNPSKNCATLVCAVLGNHTSTPASADDSAQDQDCQCVCHLQFIHTDSDIVCQQLTLGGQIVHEITLYTDFSSSRIDHPPTA